jgi:hypothetical protein
LAENEKPTLERIGIEEGKRAQPPRIEGEISRKVQAALTTGRFSENQKLAI